MGGQRRDRIFTPEDAQAETDAAAASDPNFIKDPGIRDITAVDAPDPKLTAARKDANAEIIKQRKAAKRGRLSTILTSPQGLTEPVSISKRTLIGY